MVVLVQTESACRVTTLICVGLGLPNGVEVVRVHLDHARASARTSVRERAHIGIAGVPEKGCLVPVGVVVVVG